MNVEHDSVERKMRECLRAHVSHSCGMHHSTKEIQLNCMKAITKVLKKPVEFIHKSSDFEE